MPARLLPLLALALFALPAGAFPPVPQPKENKASAKDLEKALQGTWEVTGINRGGAVGKAAAKLPPFTMTITIDGKKLSRHLNLKGKEMKGVASTFTLDTAKSPAWFDVKTELGNTGRVSAMKGLVQVAGDKMIWVYGSRDGERPKRIDGELANLQYRYTLKRVKK